MGKYPLSEQMSKLFEEQSVEACHALWDSWSETQREAFRDEVLALELGVIVLLLTKSEQFKDVRRQLAARWN